MKDESYIIAFTQGSAGRFAKYLLTNLLTDSTVELELCPITNSTHTTDNNRYTGHMLIHHPETGEPITNSHDNIWSIVKFDDPPLEPNSPKIFATHQFPDFDLIKERLGPDVKIIIITLNPHDLTEVVINDKVKNTYDMLTGNSRDVHYHRQVISELIRRYQRFLGKYFPATFVKEDIIQIAKNLATEHLAYFLNKELDPDNCQIDYDAEKRIEKYLKLPNVIDYPPEQILLLPYNKLYIQDENGYGWLQKLEQFTGKKANAETISSYQKYLDGRRELMKQYRI